MTPLLNPMSKSLLFLSANGRKSWIVNCINNVRCLVSASNSRACTGFVQKYGQSTNQIPRIHWKWVYLSMKQCSTQHTHQKFRTDTERDEVAEDEKKPHKIYDGILKTQLQRVKMFSMMTSLMGITMQQAIISAPDTHVAATVAMLGMVGFFTYATPFMIHQLAKRYVTEMIYDPEKDMYTAVRYNFFLRRNEVTGAFIIIFSSK
jgi:hypothetical protein